MCIVSSKTAQHWIYSLMKNYEAIFKCRPALSDSWLWFACLVAVASPCFSLSHHSNHSWACSSSSHSPCFMEILPLVLLLIWDYFVVRFQIVSEGFHGEVSPSSSRDKFCVHSYNLSAWSSQSSSSKISSTGTWTSGVILCRVSICNTNVMWMNEKWNASQVT